MVATTLPAVVRVVDLPTGTTITGVELLEVVQTASGVGQSIQVPISQIMTTSLGGLPTGGGTGQLLAKTSGTNFATNFSSIVSFVAVGTALATTGSATSIVAFVPNQGISSTEIANNAVGTNQVASSLGIASTLSVGTNLTVAGTLNVGGISTFGGTATFNGGLVNNGSLGIIGTVLLTGSLGVVGTSQFTGSFNVLGTSSFTGVHNVNGTALFTSGAFGVVGTTNITGTFGQVGTSLMTGQFGVVGTSQFTGIFNIAGTTNITGTFGQVGTSLMTGLFGVSGTSLHTGLFTVVGTSVFTGGFNFSVLGTSTFTGSHAVVGTALFTSGAFGVVGTALFTSGAFGVVGTAIVTGTFVLGNQGAGFLASSATGVVSATTAAGNFVLLNTLSPNNVASTNDTTSFSATYRNYLFVLENISPVTKTTTLQMQLATSGSAFLADGYVSQIAFPTAAGAVVDTATLSILISGNRATTSMQTATIMGLSGSITLFNPSSSITNKCVAGTVGYPSTSGATTNPNQLLAGNLVGYLTAVVSPVTGVNFVFSSGNIQTGTIKIYGMS